MPKPGTNYEIIVAAIYKEFEGIADVQHNEHVPVVGGSGRTRQIDVTIRSSFAGIPILMIVECKDHGRRADVGKVDSVIGQMADVGAVKGIVVSDSGFTTGAIDRAKQHGAVELCSVFDVENHDLKTKLALPIVVKTVECRMKPDFDLKFQVKPLVILDALTKEQQDAYWERFAEPFMKLFRAELPDFHKKNLNPRFIKRWDDGELDYSFGEHQYSETIEWKPPNLPKGLDSLPVDAKYIYTCFPGFYFNESVPLLKARGLSYFVNPDVNAGSGTVTISVEDINNWPQVFSPNLPTEAIYISAKWSPDLPVSKRAKSFSFTIGGNLSRHVQKKRSERKKSRRF
ncbi:MAG: restriction endonuclease [Armatimonadota bacterium]